MSAPGGFLQQLFARTARHHLTEIMVIARIFHPGSGSTLRLVAPLCRSFSKHGYGYAFSNDQSNCFASYTVNSTSWVKHAG